MRTVDIPDVAEEAHRTDNERRHALALAILAEIPDERPAGEAGERLRVKELLAHLLEFHRREEKPIWWRRFDRMEMQENELIDDPDCLGAIAANRTPAAKGQAVICLRVYLRRSPGDQGAGGRQVPCSPMTGRSARR